MLNCIRVLKNNNLKPHISVIILCLISNLICMNNNNITPTKAATPLTQDFPGVS